MWRSWLITNKAEQEAEGPHPPGPLNNPPPPLWAGSYIQVFVVHLTDTHLNVSTSAVVGK